MTILNTAAKPKRSRFVTQMEQVCLGFLIAIVTTLFVMQGYCVAGDCMQPHLFTGERVLANKIAYEVGAPKRGDIIIFRYPRDLTQTYVKRVIGLPGDTLSIHGGQVFVNDKPLPEPYRVFTAHGDLPPQFVPHDQYFMMGDNRDVSDDSRFWGDLPRRDIIGRVVACYWPPRHCQIIR